MRLYVPSGCKWNDVLKKNHKKIDNDSIGFDSISIEEGYVSVDYTDVTGKFIWCNVWDVPYEYIRQMTNDTNFKIIPLDFFEDKAYAVSTAVKIADMSDKMKFVERFKNKIFYVDSEPNFSEWDGQLNAGIEEVIKIN